METTDENVLKIGSEGVYYESFRDFPKSYFRNVYYQALLLVNDIIEKNDTLSNLYAKDGNANRKYREINNIITFIGGRGTGKTSAMLSFMEGLKDNSYFNLKNELQVSDKTIDKQEDINFTCPDCIDGSLLEAGEDIFKLILAQMYKKFRELNEDGLLKEERYEFERRTLQQRFDSVFRKGCELDELGRERTIGDESSIATLNSLSSSLALKTEFQQLVVSYLNLMRYERYERVNRSSKHYLVITIDDIDINIKRGFEMLEKIHRYLMVPNVIVLFAVDYPQMFRVCKNHFFDLLPKVNKLMKSGEREVDRLTQDYLEKVLAVSHRLYMPSFRKSRKFIVEQPFAKGALLNAKQAVLYNIAYYTGIYFDGLGIKEHFYEFSNIRQWVSFCLFFNILKTIDPLKMASGVVVTDKEEVLHNRVKNIDIMISDLSVRMGNAKLSERKEIELFKKILNVDLNRSKEIVINEAYRRLKKKKGYKPDHMYSNSYGNLIYHIYEWGRNIEEDKPLLHCLLAYYSYSLTQLVYSAAYEKSGELKRGAERKLQNFFGHAIVGRWSNKLLPKVPSEFDGQTAEILEIEWGIEFYEPHLMSVGQAEKVQLKNWKFIDITLDKLRVECEKVYEAVVFFSMFFTDLNSTSKRQVSWKVKFEHDNEMVSIKLDTETEDCLGHYNVMNFIENAYRYEEFLNELNPSFKREYENSTNGSDEINSAQKNLKKKFDRWCKNYGSYAMPVCHFDIMYNIVKRAKRNAYQNFPKYIKKDEVLKYIRMLFENIGDQLGEQDHFYSLFNVPFRTKFKDTFLSCPFVIYILENENEYLNTMIMNLLRAILRANLRVEQ